MIEFLFCQKVDVSEIVQEMLDSGKFENLFPEMLVLIKNCLDLEKDSDLIQSIKELPRYGELDLQRFSILVQS